MRTGGDRDRDVSERCCEEPGLPDIGWVYVAVMLGA